MAPEQIRDAQERRRRADIFSLGCILYELVAGRPPFEAPDILTLFQQVGSGAYPPPESLVPDLPGAVRDAIAGALKSDPAERIPDCATFVDILYGTPGAPPASKTLVGGVTLIGDSPAIQAIHTLANERRTPATTSTGANSGTWIDPAAATPAPAPNVTRMMSPATPEPAPFANSSVTSLSIDAPPPGATWAWGVVPLVAVGLAGVVLVGAIAVGAGIAVSHSSGATVADPPAAVAVPAAPVVIEPPAPVAIAPVAIAPVEVAPVAIAPVDPTVKPVRVVPKPVNVVPKPADPVVAAPIEPAAPSGATFTYNGATDVILADTTTGKEYAASAQVPPGTYKIRATFDGPDPVEAGRITLSAGQSAVLKCNAAFAQCKRQ